MLLPDRITGQLILAVVGITVVVCLSIVALEAWQPGSNTAAITALLGVAAPTVSILLVLLQGQRIAAKTVAKVEEVRAEVQRETQQAAAKVEEAQAVTAAKVEEVKSLVDKQAEMRRRLDMLEHRVEGKP